jgi:hypothetical protein
MAVVHRPRKRDLGAVYRDLDLRSVESVVVGQPFVDVFPDAIIRTTIPLWTTSAMRIFATSLFRVFIAKPRRYRVSGFVEPAAFALILAAALVPLTLVTAITAAPSLSFALTAAAAIVIVAPSTGLAASDAFVVTLAGTGAGWIVVSL